LRPGNNQPDRLLLVVDQWEDLYTLCSDKAEQQQFIDSLLVAVGNSPLSVILTLRSEFYKEALTYRPLSDALQGAVVNIAPMTREELRRVIVQPAQMLGLSFESGLVDRILEEVGHEPDTLPLLEFALAELWETRVAGQMLHSRYEAIGGGSAIAERAERAFASLTASQQEAARRILVQLVIPGEGAEDSRRRASKGDLSPIGREVVAKLTAERLLVITKAADGTEIVELAHDALIRQWPRLRGWVDDNRQVLRQLVRLEAEASRWLAGGMDVDLLLPSGRRLEEAKELSARAELWAIGPLVGGYIDASMSQARARTLVRRRFWVAAVATSLFLAVLVAVGTYWAIRLATLHQG
jgi:hypothetical protein